MKTSLLEVEVDVLWSVCLCINHSSRLLDYEDLLGEICGR